uniref:Transcription factor AP-2 C-terminal domain-containing protein n=1 Tax=Panagrolaimus sp. ES5 TaxID=591445 RepID=A0AC34EYT8_9BILA
MMPSQLQKSDEIKPPSVKRPRPTSESTDDGESLENYSPPPQTSDTSNIFNNPGPLAHSTPMSMSLMNQQLQQHQQQQQQQQLQQMQQTADFSNFMNPMMQQQWAAHYQMLQQQQQQPNVSGYPMQQQQQHPMQQQNMYNNSSMLNLDNTHTSSSSDDSGNSSIIQAQQPPPPPQNLNRPANEVEFCSVPGRLALLSQNKKVKVTLAEIQRRIAAPECLNASLLSAILRKAKNREGGKVLSNDLAKHNISLAAGRRKSAPNTAFTALVEAESLTLAKDFQELTDKHFPFNDIAYEFIKCITSIEEWQSSMVVIYNYVGFPQCFGVLQRLMAILSFDKSPIGEFPLNVPTLLHPESQKNFTHFSLLSHGFGIPAHHASWNSQLKVFRVLYEAMINPRTFCTKIGRPIPESIASLEPLILMAQQQQQQQQQILQHSGYPGQMSQQQSIPKEHLNGYIQ